MPKISVIMPAYNAEKYIKEAIDSILGQTFRDFELIVLNDCSRDSTEAIILSYQDPRVVYMKNEENLGVAGTLNRGLDHARGEYIARMDADDIALPHRLERQAAFLDAHPDVIGCGSNAILFGELSGNTDMPFGDRNIRLRLALSNPFVHPTMLLRKAGMQDARYDRSFEGREDYRMWMVLSQLGKMENLPEPLLRYRVHKGQVTQKPDDTKAQKHFRLKKTYYQELNIGLTAQMQEALCHAAYYGKVTDEPMARSLKAGLACIAGHYGSKKLPKEYAVMLCSVLEGYPKALRRSLSGGLPLKNRLKLWR